jgi:signal peptidase I
LGQHCSSFIKDHPIYQYTEDYVSLLYNIGIEWNTYYLPQDHHPNLYPARYAYFDNGNLCLLGHPIFEKQDLTLQSFINREHQLASAEFHPFVDQQAPLLPNGS